VLSASQARARGVVFAGLELFISYIFRNWQFRKIYFETFEFNLGQFASASGLVFDIEGRLRDYEYMDGRYWDLIVGSIHRNDWPKRLHERRSEVSSRGEALRNAVPPTDLLSEEPFCRLLEDMRNESGVKEAIKVTLDTEWADLALDSLEALELLDLLEGLTGTTISDGSDVTRWTFVRDIYRFYLELAQRPIRGS
jgi:acyl carrier protein